MDVKARTQTDSGEIRFTGFSDDILDVSGELNDEFSNTRGEISVVIAGPEYGALLVHARLSMTACWSLGVGPLDEGPLPPWPVRIEQGPDCEYSPVLIVAAPLGSTVTEVHDAF